jgi:hypothetical protein
MQANPDASACRLSSSLEHPHLPKLANPARLSPNAPSRWCTLPRPRIYPKRGIHGHALTTIGSLPPNCLRVYTHQAASGISLPKPAILCTITEFTPSSGGSVPFQPSTAGNVLFRADGRIEVGESGWCRQLEVIVILRLSFPCCLSLCHTMPLFPML